MPQRPFGVVKHNYLKNCWLPYSLGLNQCQPRLHLLQESRQIQPTFNIGIIIITFQGQFLPIPVIKNSSVLLNLLVSFEMHQDKLI